MYCAHENETEQTGTAKSAQQTLNPTSWRRKKAIHSASTEVGTQSPCVSSSSSPPPPPPPISLSLISMLRSLSLISMPLSLSLSLSLSSDLLRIRSSGRSKSSAFTINYKLHACFRLHFDQWVFPFDEFSLLSGDRRLIAAREWVRRKNYPQDDPSFKRDKPVGAATSRHFTFVGAWRQQVREWRVHSPDDTLNFQFSSMLLYVHTERPYGPLGTGTQARQDGHLDFHTALARWRKLTSHF